MFIFDLDGTLADDSHRVPLIEGRARTDAAAWDQYYRLCLQDPPIWPLTTILQRMHSTHHCAVWTGRCDRVRAETVEWLTAHVFLGSKKWNDPNSFHHVPLRMRPQQDLRRSHELKREWAQEHLAKKLPIVLVFEDHAPCVRMWRALGVAVAAVGNKEYDDG